MLSNVMSLAPKIVEVAEFILRNDIDLACITETWLKERVADSVVDISGYSIIRRDRNIVQHGGVCLYIKDNYSKYHILEGLQCCDDHEILWVYLRPRRLPRGFSCLILAIVYHPDPSAGNDDHIREHLSSSLNLAESLYPNCAFVVCGDFNRLNVTLLKRHFRLKQIVKVPTRKNVTLDLILTNLQAHYKDPVAFPPFGLSDHNTVLASAKIRQNIAKTNKFVLRRDLRASRKAELGRYLASLDWRVLFSGLDKCEELLNVWQTAISTGLDLLMPLKRVLIKTCEAPWMNSQLKSLILKRQQAFHKLGADSIQFKFYRNAVNRKRKICKAKFYESKVEDMKEGDPKSWWKEVKRLSGSQPSSTGSLLSHLSVDGLEDLPANEVADAINHALLEPLEEYRLPSDIPFLALEEDHAPEFLVVPEQEVYQHLLQLKAGKAGGPDGIPNWILKDHAECLAFPVTAIMNASFKEQRLPNIWKFADVTPLPKKKPVKELKKDLRPISLTPSISKVAEEFVVTKYVRPAVLSVLDPSQYGAVPKSCTTFALLEMLHVWSQGTDGNGSTIRTVLLDYRKAFDLIDHSILVSKLSSLVIPVSIVNWIIDFLSHRSQRIKLAGGCVSEWGSVPSGVPQGTKLGPWLFLIMINDLVVNKAFLWKYVDDTTVSEITGKGEDSHAQSIVDEVADWSSRNKVQLNKEKCKELRISFAKVERTFPPIVIGGEELKLVDNAKLLGLTISNDLTWNAHITDVVKKASKRLYFLIQLKRAKVSIHDLCLFYTTCVRSVIDYAAPVFHYALPLYLSNELERIQRRALRIICPFVEYKHALTSLGLPTIAQHHVNICERTFNSIISDQDHKLKKLLPPVSGTRYNLRHARTFIKPRCKTNRFKNSFLISSLKNVYRT